MLYYLSLKKKCNLSNNPEHLQGAKSVEIVRPEETCPIGDGTFNF